MVKDIIDKYLKKDVNESEDGGMGYTTAAPYAHKKKKKQALCPYCQNTIDLDSIDMMLK